MTETIGLIPSAIIVVFLAILVIPLFIYFPLYSLFGGWDDDTLEVFKQAVKISGPSKGFVGLIYKISKKVSSISPLHNRFPIKSDDAFKEIRELMEIRDRNRELLQKEAEKNEMK